MKIKSKSRQSQHLRLKQVPIVALITFFAAMEARSAEISGTAYAGHSNKGELGVGVSLSRSGDSHRNPKQQFTREDGNYSFKNLAPGKYRLDFKKVGFTIVVPYKEAIEVSSNSTTKEPVRVFSQAQTANIDPQRVVAFLRERAKGDSKRLAADIMALRESKAFQASTVNTIVLALSDVERTAGRLYTLNPFFNTLTLVPNYGSTPVEYGYNKHTIVLEPYTGRASAVDVRLLLGLSKPAIIEYTTTPEGRYIASKIILDSRVAGF